MSRFMTGDFSLIEDLINQTLESLMKRQMMKKYMESGYSPNFLDDRYNDFDQND